jgi:hypothetical protein
MTVFKLFVIIFICRPYQSLLVCLRPPPVVVLGGLTLVTILGKHTVHTCVALVNLVSMGPTVITRRRRTRFASGGVIALLLEQSSDLLECLLTFFQQFFKTRICVSQCSHNNMVHHCGCCQVCKCINGFFSKAMCRLRSSSIGIPRGSSEFALHLLVLTVGRCKVDLEAVPSYVTESSFNQRRQAI